LASAKFCGRDSISFVVVPKPVESMYSLDRTVIGAVLF
jgi:hypothetical protein